MDAVQIHKSGHRRLHYTIIIHILETNNYDQHANKVTLTLNYKYKNLRQAKSGVNLTPKHAWTYTVRTD